MYIKKFNVIIKVSDTEFIKYRAVTDLLRLTKYLDDKKPNWRYFNVFDSSNKEQIASYTKKSKPKYKWLIR